MYYVLLALAALSLSCTSFDSTDYRVKADFRKPQSSPLNLKRDQAGNCTLYVPCTLNYKNFDCFLDTGAAITMIDDIPEFRRYPVAGSAKQIDGHGKENMMPLVRLPTLEIANLSYNRLIAGRTTLPAIVDGVLLGSHLFSGRNLQVLFSKGVLSFQRQFKPAKMFELSYVNDTIPLLRVRIGDATLNAIWDTGAQVSLIDQQIVKANPDTFKNLGVEAEVLTLSNNRESLQRWQAKAMQIGGSTHENPRFFAGNLSQFGKSIETKLDMILGLDVISAHDWFFDFDNNLWANKPLESTGTTCQ